MATGKRRFQRNHICRELRDQADKKVHFAAISLDGEKLLFDELQTEERWLTGIETAYNGVLIIT